MLGRSRCNGPFCRIKPLLTIKVPLKILSERTYAGASVKQRHDSLLFEKMEIPPNGHIRYIKYLGGLPDGYLPLFPYDTAKLFPTGNSR